MRSILATAIFLLAAGCTAERPMQASAEAQSEIAAELAGRTAGEPQSCVPQRDLQGNRTVGGAIVFSTRSRDLIYVNDGDCPELGSGRALVTRTTISQLCAGDIVEVIDPLSPISYGSCGLGRFTPYRRLR